MNAALISAPPLWLSVVHDGESRREAGFRSRGHTSLRLGLSSPTADDAVQLTLDRTRDGGLSLRALGADGRVRFTRTVTVDQPLTLPCEPLIEGGVGTLTFTVRERPPS